MIRCYEKEQNVMQESNSSRSSCCARTQIFESHIRALSNKTGFYHLSKPLPERPLMEGRLFPLQLSQDLRLHLVDCYEKETAESSSEVSPGISINLVYEADITFSLGGAKYGLQHSANSASDGLPVLHSLVIGRSDLFSRHIKDGNRVKKLNILISPAWLCARFEKGDAVMMALNKSHGLRDVTGLPPELRAAAQRLINMKSAPDTCERLGIESDVLKIIAASVRRLGALMDPAEVKDADSFPRHYLMKLVDDAVESGASLGEIARAGHMSVSTLQSQFKRTFNITVQKYIRKRVLERARWKLISSNISIGEAAYQAGYNHSSNFITAFRREFGMTPAECVAEHRSCFRTGV